MKEVIVMETLAQVHDMKLNKKINERIDQLELAMAEAIESGDAGSVDFPLLHEFHDGFYHRTIFMPANVLICSKIHKTKHEFDVWKGVVAVKVNAGKWKLIKAPYKGVTLPGTRRVLFVIEDCLWTTHHKLEEGETTPEQVEDRIIQKHNHPFIEYKNSKLGNGS